MGYLDAVGGQPALPVARTAFAAAMDQGWADPARLHHRGRRAGLVLDTSREAIATLLQVPAAQCYLGASGADVLRAAVLGIYAARQAAGAPPRILVGATESMAVLFAAQACPGAEIVMISVDSTGAIDVENLTTELAAGAALVCVQQANAEVGTLQPIDHAYAVCGKEGVPLISEAMQVAGHQTIGDAWDALVAVPRDWGGVAGCGVLAVKADLRWRPPEAPDRGWVGGFPDVAAAAACGTAAEYMAPLVATQANEHREMIDTIRSAARSWPGVTAVGDPDHRLPHILTLVAEGVVGEVLVTELDRMGVAVASGSACTADTRMASHVLEAMGWITPASVRISLPLGCTKESIDLLLDAFPRALSEAR